MARARWMLSAQQGALKSSQWLRLQSTLWRRPHSASGIAYADVTAYARLV